MLKINIGAVILSALLDLVNSDYCWYIHEDYSTVQQKYCRSGCCQEYGDGDEICCFEWSVGIIIAIIFAAVTIIAILVIMIICCYTMKKKRNRTVTNIDNGMGGANITNTVIYSGASGYSYPHPPSAFYPSSQFPNAPPAYGPPPKYGMYPPTDSGQSLPTDTSQSQNGSLPPSYSSVMTPGFPPSQQYGGYGPGMT